MALDHNHNHDQNGSADRHRDIIAAAVKVFDAHGYAAATMDAVAAEAGISKGSIYNYFSSKGDLFMRVFSEALGGSMAQAEQILAAPIPAGRKLTQMLDNWSRQLAYYRQIGRLVLEFWVAAAREHGDGAFAAWFEQHYAEWRRVLRAVLAEGVATGEFRADLDVAVTASLIVATVDGITIQTILAMAQGADQPSVEQLQRELIDGLARPSRPAMTEG